MKLKLQVSKISLMIKSWNYDCYYNNEEKSTNYTLYSAGLGDPGL